MADTIYQPESHIHAQTIVCDDITAKSITAQAMTADDVTADTIDAQSITADNVKARFIRCQTMGADIAEAGEVQCSGSVTCDVWRVGKWTGRVVADRIEKP